MSDDKNVPDGVDDLRVQIEETRDELADTVQALAAKADVKGRAKAKAQETRAQAQVKAQETLGQAQAKAHETLEQAQVKARETRDQVQATAADKPWLVPAAGAGGLIALVLGVWLTLRRRK